MTHAFPAHPLDLPAEEIGSGIREGRFRAETIIAESLRRARIVNDRLNAFTLIREEAAIQAARDADRRVAAREPGLPPLLGVPFAAKDLTPTQGDVTTLGSWSRGDWVPDETALCVARLQSAGAILVAKTTTPEFAYSSFTASPRWGITRNPWNPGRTSGGSSGGSAVAVATGVVPFAEGTDMGGSVRIPASLSGVVGFKPSLGRIPMTILPSCFDTMSHFGPLARSVADAATFLRFTSGPDDADILSLPMPFLPERTAPASLRGKRFAFSPDLGYYHVEPQVREVIDAAIACLRASGAVVEKVDLTWTRAVNDGWHDLWCVFMSGFFGEGIEAHRSRMDPNVLDLIDRGMTLDATSVKRLELLRTAMWKDFSAVLSGCDAVLMPTCAVTAPSALADDNDFVATRADGRLAGLDMTCPFNLLPQCPALSLPAGLAADGLPVGLQVVGQRYADEDVLSLSAGIEAALAGAGLGVGPAPGLDP